jgi:hypothetical protein
MELKNFHVIRVVYLPATRILNGRFKIISDRFKQSYIITRDSLYTSLHGDSTYLICIASKLQSEGFNVLGMGNGDGCDYLITDTFQPLKTL